MQIHRHGADEAEDARARADGGVGAEPVAEVVSADGGSDIHDPKLLAAEPALHRGAEGVEAEAVHEQVHDAAAATMARGNSFLTN